MLKEIKYFFFLLIIFLSLFLTVKYYFSDSFKKKSYRSLTNLDNKIKIYSKKIPILEDNTQNIIEYVEGTQTKKKKKYYFWELIN